MGEEKTNPFYNLPKKVWDVLLIIFIAVAIVSILTDGILFLYRVERVVKLALGITGIISAFIVLLLMLYSYIPAVKSKWEKQKIDAMLNDPRNAEYIAKYTQAKEDEVQKVEEDDTVSNEN